MPQQQQQVQPSLADLDKPKEAAQQSTAATTTTSTDAAANDKPDESAQQQQNQQPQQTDTTDVTDTNDTGDNDDAADTQDADAVEDPLAFYGEVTKLRGDGLPWKFPDDIDPLSPAGVHYAIQQAVNHDMDIFERNLQAADPRGYAYLLHRSNGGTDEEFFQEKTEVLPDLDVLKGSVDSQQAFYKRALGRKGISGAHADLIIKDAVEKNALFGLVEAEHGEMKTRQDHQLKEIQRIDTEMQQRQEQAIQQMGNILKKRIIENEGLGITIPDAKRGDFLRFVNEKMMYDKESGRFYVQQEISNDNFAHILESLYFQSVKGNMDDIIRKTANTKVAKQMRLRMNQDKPKSTQVDPNRTNNSKPGIQPALSEL